MKRLIAGLYAVPALSVMVASLAVGERILVDMIAVLAYALTVVITTALVGFVGFKRERLGPVCLFGGVAVTLIGSVVLTHWPLRAAYRLSRPALEQLAHDVQAGRSPRGPTRAGLFLVRRAEVSRNGVTCLWVGLGGSGRTGFVQCGAGRGPFNLWSIIDLDGRWQFIAED